MEHKFMRGNCNECGEEKIILVSKRSGGVVESLCYICFHSEEAELLETVSG